MSSLSVLVLSLPSSGYSSLVSSHSSSLFSILLLPRPTAWAVFVLRTKGVVRIEGSFQKGREEALVFLSHKQMHYLCFCPLAGVPHRRYHIFTGFGLSECVCVEGAVYHRKKIRPEKWGKAEEERERVRARESRDLAHETHQ